MSMHYNFMIFNVNLQIGYQINSHITVFTVLDGKAVLEFEEDQIELRKGELYVMNFGKLYKIDANNDTIIAELRIEYDELLKSTGKKRLKFGCNTRKDTAKSHYQLKKTFSQLLRLYVIGERKFEELSYYYKFISILLNEYMLYSKDSGEEFEEDRMNQIRLYLHTHFKEKITLNDICSRFYISTSTFVRNFKKQNDMSMIQYLNEIRIQAAKQLLLESNNSVTDVALEVGFADASTFIKTFKKTTGISPLKFKQRIVDRDNQMVKNQELIKIVEKTFSIEIDRSQDDVAHKIYRRSEVHYHPEMMYDKPMIQAVGIQEAAVLLNTHYQQSLIKMRNLMGLKYVRIPFLLSKTMLNNNTRSLNFDQIDIVLDFIVENKMIPIIELSGRHQRIQYQSTMLAVEETSKYDHIHQEFESVISLFLDHVFYRFAGDYGRLTEWIWEFQFTRNTKDLDEYLRHFEIVRDKISQWGGQYRLGGYGIDLYDWDENEISLLAQHSFSPDFFSVNSYPYFCSKKEGRIQYLQQVIDPHYLHDEMIKLHKALKNYGYDHTPVYVTQWNSSLAKGNTINDSYVKASMTVKMIVSLLGLADLFVYDTLQDIKPEILQEEMVLFGGKGLISKDGLIKSVFNAIASLSCLDQKIMVCSDHLIFSALKKNHFVGICMNQKNFNISYYQKSEKDIKEEDIPYFFDDQDVLEQEICISDLANGTYRIRLAVISEERSIATRLRKMCNHVYLDLEDLQFLKKENTFDIQLIEKNVSEGNLEFSIIVKPNETVLINVFPVCLNN